MSETQSQAKYRGIPVWIDGREYIIPSLSVSQFRNHIEGLNQYLADALNAKIDAASASPEDAAKAIQAMTNGMNRLVPVIGLAMRRNYPDITDEWLFDNLDLYSWVECVRAVQASSGMRPLRPGESQPAAIK